MLEKPTSIMIYVNEPRLIADFWINNFDFVEIKQEYTEERSISVELATHNDSDLHLVLFDKKIVAEMSPELNLGTPSILLSSLDIESLRTRLIEASVTVGNIIETDDIKTFNFADPEGNYFAVQEI